MEIHERLEAQMPEQKPEGVSVLVRVPEEVGPQPDEVLGEAARILARDWYPGRRLTGRVLGIFRDANGAGTHEVVLEVAR